jgi:hypothetical protein
MRTNSLSSYFSYKIILKIMNNMCGGMRNVLLEAYVSAHLNICCEEFRRRVSYVRMNFRFVLKVDNYHRRRFFFGNECLNIL